MSLLLVVETMTELRRRHPPEHLFYSRLFYRKTLYGCQSLNLGQYKRSLPNFNSDFNQI